MFSMEDQFVNTKLWFLHTPPEFPHGRMSSYTEGVKWVEHDVRTSFDVMTSVVFFTSLSAKCLDISVDGKRRTEYFLTLNLDI